MPVRRVKFFVRSGGSGVAVYRLVHALGYRVLGLSCGGISLLRLSGIPGVIVHCFVHDHCHGLLGGQCVRV